MESMIAIFLICVLYLSQEYNDIHEQMTYQTREAWLRGCIGKKFCVQSTMEECLGTSDLLLL